MTKPLLGTKRKCLACNTSFFDLLHDPIFCPKCKTLFTPPPPLPVSYKRKVPLPNVPAPPTQQESAADDNLESVIDNEDDEAENDNDPAESDEVPDEDAEL